MKKRSGRKSKRIINKMPSTKISLDDLKKSACWKLNMHLHEETVKKRSKYNSSKVEIDNHVFDSKKEARRYVELRMLERIGEISGLQHHEVFQLSVCKYISDFSYYRNGEKTVEDVKSAATRKLPTYRLKLKMMEAELGIRIKEF